MRRLLSVAVWFCGVSILCAAPDDTPFPTPPHIKGLQVQMADDALALGVHHAAINVNITALLERVDASSGGTNFVFNEGYLQSLDRQIKPLSDQGAVVYAILLAYPSKDPVKDAVTVHAQAKRDYSYSVGAFNTATELGCQYLSAVGSLLAKRWSGSLATQHGRVWGWIVGNEVNSHFLWYNLGRAPLAGAVVEYEKAFRILHSAVRQHSAQGRLYVSFDHHWAVAMHGVSAEEAVPGKAFLDAFAQQVKRGGDLDWHVAWHPYPEDLGNPRAWADKSVTRDESTPKVTFKNLEVLCRYLERPELAWQGKPRRLILSEQGFHTLATPEGETLQAAAYAYAWEKCRRLPLVDAFIYHRHVDHAHEGGLRLGLWTNRTGSVADPEKKKPVYDVFLKAGTPAWKDAAQFALPICGFSDWNSLDLNTSSQKTPER